MTMPRGQRPARAEGDDLLDTLAEEFVARLRSGARPAVAEYLQRYPDMAEPIRELFPALVLLERMASRDAGRGNYSFLSGIKQPDVLGDYRILQEVGRGGMGIVYEAEQISLGRHVALKVLPFQLATDSAAIARFRQEARAAAALQHPNIVGVYDVGEEDSVWYYAMQFVHGQSLSEVLKQLQQVRCPQTCDEPISALATSLLDRKLKRFDSESGERQPWDTATVVATDEEVLVDCPRTAAIEAITASCLRRLHAGETYDKQDILTKHGALLPELAESLAIVELLSISRLPQVVDELAALSDRRARGQPPGEDSPSPRPMELPTSVAREQLRLSDGSMTYAPCDDHQYFQNVAHLGRQVANALSYAHQQGVVHRDIKPANLILDTRGTLWVTDFGLAKLDDEVGSSTGRFVGTLRYMAPEQIRGHASPQTDIYSLGITLYEMLLLCPAFGDANYLDMIDQICHHGPTPPRRLQRNIPRDLETIVLKAIQRNPQERYPSAAEMADDLDRFLRSDTILARRQSRLSRAWMSVTHDSHARLIGACLLSSLATAAVATAISWRVIDDLQRSLDRPGLRVDETVLPGESPGMPAPIVNHR